MRSPRCSSWPGADRIGIAGFSFGGEVAHLTAFETLRAAMEAGSSRFAAHVATYPGGTYGARAEAGAYTGAPILMLLGEKDDNLPVAKVEGYLAYASGEGHPAPITTAVYPGEVTVSARRARSSSAIRR